MRLVERHVRRLAVDRAGGREDELAARLGRHGVERRQRADDVVAVVAEPGRAPNRGRQPRGKVHDGGALRDRAARRARASRSPTSPSISAAASAALRGARPRGCRRRRCRWPGRPQRLGGMTADVPGAAGDKHRCGSAASNGVIREAVLLHLGWREEVAAVEDQRRLHQRLHAIEIGLAELIPFGHDRQRIGALQRVVVRIGVVKLVAEDAAWRWPWLRDRRPAPWRRREAATR